MGYNLFNMNIRKIKNGFLLKTSPNMMGAPVEQFFEKFEECIKEAQYLLSKRLENHKRDIQLAGLTGSG